MHCFAVYTLAETSDFKFGTQFGFAKANTKITPRRKSGLGFVLEKLLKIWGSPLIFLQRLKLACSWGLPRHITKFHPEEKVSVDLG